MQVKIKIFCRLRHLHWWGTNDKGQVVEGDGDIEISAACIHLGVRSLYHQKCVMHTHAPYLTSLSKNFSSL